jgi:hypothetical protein
MAYSEKRKAVAQNLKFKHIVLYIEFHLSYLAYYIAKMKRERSKTELKI